MIRLICVISVAAAMMFVTRCGDGPRADSDLAPAAKRVDSGSALTSGGAPEFAVAAAKGGGKDAKPPARAAKQPPAQNRKIDIDLTKMNPMMTFAQVQNMMTKPDEYLGKVVRASGPYNVWCYAGTDECHHFVVITDALACCQSGIEFQWPGGRPRDYPNELEVIEVIGVFKSYEKFERTLHYIEVDGIGVVEK